MRKKFCRKPDFEHDLFISRCEERSGWVTDESKEGELFLGRRVIWPLGDDPSRPCIWNNHSSFFEIHIVGNIGIIDNFCILVNLLFAALFWHYDVSECEFIYQFVWEYCILKLYSPLALLFSNGTAKMKLAMLAFLCWGLFRKKLLCMFLHHIVCVCLTVYPKSCLSICLFISW